MKDEKTKAQFKALGCLVLILLMPVTMALHGWVLSILWRWFIVATFDAKPLGIVQAMGVSILVQSMIANYNRSKDEEWWETALKEVMVPLLTLVLAWALHLFM